MHGIKTSSASSPSPSKSVCSMAVDGNFKYPLAFYCKICNKPFNDPRILDCLHTFCCQCLAQIDASNNLQNNQFWRKASDSSSCMYTQNLHCKAIAEVQFSFVSCIN